MGVINAVAQFERDLIVERTNAGLARAKSEGKRFGRPPALSPQQQNQALERLKAGESVSKVAKAFGVSRVTISRLRDKA